MAAALMVALGCDVGRLAGEVPAHISSDSDTGQFVPTAAETETALEEFVDREGELVPTVPSQTVLWALDRVQISYTRAPIRFTGNVAEPSGTIAGYDAFQTLIAVKVDATRRDTSTNALIHELVHSVLWQGAGDPAWAHSDDPSGLWTARTDVAIQETMDALKP